MQNKHLFSCQNLVLISLINFNAARSSSLLIWMDFKALCSPLLLSMTDSQSDWNEEDGRWKSCRILSHLHGLLTRWAQHDTTIIYHLIMYNHVQSECVCVCGTTKWQDEKKHVSKVGQARKVTFMGSPVPRTVYHAVGTLTSGPTQPLRSSRFDLHDAKICQYVQLTQSSQSSLSCPPNSLVMT